MKRAIKWWPKFNLTSPEKSDFIFGASYGLITIQAYHELDMMKMAQGKNKTIVGLVINRLFAKIHSNVDSGVLGCQRIPEGSY